MDHATPAPDAATTDPGLSPLARSALDLLPDPLCCTDPHGRLLYANRAACAALGRAPEEVGTADIEGLCPDFPTVLRPERWEELKARGSLTFEVKRRAADDRWRIVDVTAHYGTWQGEEVVCALARDVTERLRTERQLRDREERLRVIFETSRAAILLVGAAGTIEFANGRAAEMFGCPLERFVGSAYPSHLHPAERAVGDDRMRRLIAGEIDHVSVERHYVRADGSDFWGYLSGRRHEDADGNLVSLVGVIADITERKRAEDELRKSQERCQALIELAADAILQGDPTGRIIGANVNAAVLTGYTADELMALESIGALFSEEERRRVPLRYDLLQQGHTVRSERVLTRKDGAAVPIEMNSKQMPDGTYQAVIRDVGERKRAEDILRASEAKFAAAFHHAPVLMTISSVADGTYLDVNDTFCRVSGFTREEAVGKTSLELGWVSPGDRERILAELGGRGRVTDLELVLTAKGGRPVHCLYSGEPIPVDGETRLLSIAVDVTEKARLQEELVKTQRLESLGLLAGGLAHDFNNILTGIVGNLSLARVLVGETHRAAERLAECEKAAVRASALTQQLLTFSRGGAPVRAVVDAAGLVREAISFALRGSNVKGAADLDADLWSLDADEGQLSQVLHNLLLNAKQAMPSGGVVTVRGRNVTIAPPGSRGLRPGRYVRLDVEDTGAGIPDSLLGKIFDPYFTTKPGGSGLGLSSVYSIVKRHGGRVTVSSAPGQGSIFAVHLPAAEEAGQASPPAPPARLPTGGGGRILVMDDEAMILELAGEMLRVLGYEAVSCPDGAAAVELFRVAREAGEPFEAAILDLTVPGAMGGREAAEAIRSLDPGAVLIVSSGYSNDPVLADLHSSPFSGAVVKPYSVGRLAEELGRLRAREPAVR